MRRRVTAFALTVVACIACTAIATLAGDGVPPTQRPAATEIPRGYVSRATLGADWPLSVDDGVLHCQPRKAGDLTVQDITLMTGGKRYAINGSARAGIVAGAYLDPAEITAPGANLQPLVEIGLKYCL